MMRRRSWMVLAGASLIACSSTDTGAPSTPDGGADVVTANVDSGDSGAEGAAVTQTIGAAGGSVSAGGAVLTIPAGALASDIQISITPSADSIPAGYTGLSPLYRLGPKDAVFLTPATVELALTSTGPSPTVFLSNSGGGYDALATSVASSGVSAPMTHLGDCFVAVGASASDSGTGAGDSSDVTDSGAIADSSSIADSGAPDDSAVGDAGVVGLSVTIDGVPTTFATNAQASLTGPDTSIQDSIVQADDNASTTHWHLQLVVTGVATQSCAPYLQPTYPQITYTHFTGGTLDATFSTHVQNHSGNTCAISLVGNPAMASGDHARGTFTGTVYGSADAGAPHVFSAGSYDEVIP
jgi:hypothetical protein